MDITRKTADLVGVALLTAGLTPVEVSKQTLIPRTTLLRRLNGNTPFTVSELEQIAGLIGVPVHSLIPGTDSHPRNAASDPQPRGKAS